jgi:hypothetical protein
MSSPYVFISYSRQDRQFVERLSRELQLAGIQTWIDTQNISAGANWQQEIEKGLLKADVLLYVASSQASSSAWIELELQAFLKGSGRIIPLIIDDAGSTSMPPSLQTIQWVDFRQDFQSAVRQLLAGIQGLRGDSPVEAPKEKSKGYVFISYASEDAEFVLDLKSFLAQRGYSFWDFQTSKRNYQLDYTLELEERISNAEATLSVVSPSWKKSSTALQELHYSKEVETPIFLLRLKNPGPTLALAGLTFIDFTESRADGFNKLASEMRDVGL